jgi:Ala-tRNA(Pro) deacylase
MASFECHKNLDIHGLEHIVKQGKLSFASPERMDRCIGVTPGSVCAFGLIHDMNLVEHPAILQPDGTRDFGQIKEGVNPKELFDNGHRVKYFLDADLKNADRVSFHPCENTASVVVSNAGFMRFLEIWGGDVEWIEVQ